MNRTLTPFATLAAIMALGLAACENPGASAQDKVNQAQAEADKAASEARAEADKKATSAQAQADKKIASLQADFAKVREDYRHTVQTHLDDLDKTFAELDAKAKTEKGKSKIELEAKIADIRARRSVFVANFRTLDRATAENWDATKTRLDQAWADIKAAVDKAA